MPGGRAGTLDASVLTFILVVVLGGGVALLAISLAESSQPATETDEPDRGDLADPAPRQAPTGSAEPVSAPAPEPEREPEPEPTVAAPFAPVTSIAERGDAHEPVRRRHRGSVPKQFTALEGRYADVAGAPLWRRLASLVGIVVITVVFGVASAAVLGAIIAAVAQLANDAIG